MEEVTTDKGFEGRVLACRMEAWGRGTRAEGCKALGAESWMVGA